MLEHSKLALQEGMENLNESLGRTQPEKQAIFHGIT